MENKVTAEFSNIFAFLDNYFDTFELLHFSITDCIDNYVNEKKVYSKVLADETNYFIVNERMIIDAIFIERYDGKDVNILKDYIEKKYTKIMQRLTEVEYIDDYYSLPFPITERMYFDVERPLKMIFFYNLVKNTNSQQTIRDFQNAIILELEAGYNKIMEVFTGTSTYRITLDKELENKVLKIYQFWNNTEKDVKGNNIITKNIFKDINQHDFLEMVCNADFSEIYNKSKCKYRVGQTVIELSKIINDEKWTEQAAKTLKTTIRNLQKNSQYLEKDAWESYPMQ